MPEWFKNVQMSMKTVHITHNMYQEIICDVAGRPRADPRLAPQPCLQAPARPAGARGRGGGPEEPGGRLARSEWPILYREEGGARRERPAQQGGCGWTV